MTRSPAHLPTDKAYNKRYLRPSVFWSIRQEFPGWLPPLLISISLLSPLLLWSLLSYGNMVDPRFLPTPDEVIRKGVVMFREQSLWVDVLFSVGRVMAGFALAGLVGIPVGLLMGTFYSMDGLLGGFVRMARYLPINAFGPLMVIWAGIDEMPKVLLIFFGIVFYNATMVADAVKFIPTETLNVAYTLGANRLDLLRRVILPATLPSIFDTLRLNVAAAWNLLVISELIAASDGLAMTIFKSQRSLQTDQAIFCILVICAIGLASDFAFKLLARWCLPWAEVKMS